MIKYDVTINLRTYCRHLWRSTLYRVYLKSSYDYPTQKGHLEISAGAKQCQYK